ncbi:MAG: hypothetical protein A2V66_06590 [Ignavibacteria bacterium RBG_13_36_8]|nr:MAG: hypothetical protein A2V66_06590 [Ignavibacteria bacterium RBG_13_36_8]
METILNIYLVIEKNHVAAFRAKAYELEGDDEDKIKFLKGCAKKDFESAYRFDAPTNRLGNFMKYNKFAKLEEQGMQYRLFEEIFEKFNVPQNPLICVTPVMDGEILSQ